MAEETISSTTAITAFGIATGVASGIAAVYLSNQYAEKKITKSSMVLGITIAVVATFAGAFLYKTIEKA